MTSCTQILVRLLYPRPYLDRWGEDLCDAARSEGWRSWPNLVASAAAIWLQPAIWPPRHRGQRTARASAMVLAVAGCGWFIANLITEDADPVLRQVLRGCAAALLVGCGLVTPLPHPNRTGLAAVVRRSMRYFAVPVVLVATVVITVHGGVLPRIPPVPIRLAVVSLWWIGWLLAVGAGSRVLANLGPDTVIAPSRRRAGAGGVVLAAVAVITGAVLLIFAFSGARFDPFAAICGALTLVFGVAGTAALCELPSLADD
ncbi:hypothetical protein [Nocardia sp. NPDC059239]|uniref:hypothetical protein n=1 Tax=Nocardia sp. NPDC059239 TaxID=3346785 RepID=UPI00369ABE40